MTPTNMLRLEYDLEELPYNTDVSPPMNPCRSLQKRHSVPAILLFPKDQLFCHYFRGSSWTFLERGSLRQTKNPLPSKFMINGKWRQLAGSCLYINNTTYLPSYLHRARSLLYYPALSNQSLIELFIIGQTIPNESCVVDMIWISFWETFSEGWYLFYFGFFSSATNATFLRRIRMRDT
jgi:hypothetical protein